MSDSVAPVLIIGPPRSGSTLLATMLNAHPRLFIANEAKVFVQWLPGALDQPVGEPLADKLIADLESNELEGLAPLPGGREVLNRAADKTMPGFLRALFEMLADREGKARWGEKTAVAYRALAEIRSAFPDAQLLALDRDPQQIAASFDKMIPKWGGLGGLLEWIDFRRAVTESAAPIHMVSYQGLIRDPEGTLRQVCAFLGEEFDPAMLEYFKTPRAKALEASPVFAGASRPIDPEKQQAAPVLQGIRGRLAQWLLEVGNRSGDGLMRPSWGERILRAMLFVKATAWELGQPDFTHRVFRRLRRG